MTADETRRVSHTSFGTTPELRIKEAGPASKGEQVPLTDGRPISVEIIVNNFNYAEYLSVAVDSALAQTHPDVSVTVVDDGSTDGSRELLDAYGERIRTVLKTRGGQASALNAGFADSHADIVMFLDSDDVLYPEAAARVAAAFVEVPDAARAHFRMRVIDGEGRVAEALKPAASRPLPAGDLRRAVVTYPFDLTWTATTGNAFARAALQRIMPIPAAGYPDWGADWYLVHVASLLGPVIAIDQPLAAYRIHGRNGIEPSDLSLDLVRLRREVTYQQSTINALIATSDELGLPRPATILSLSNLANRLILLRLDPGHHPVANERRGRLLLDALRAAMRRDDITAASRALLVAVLVLIALVPRPVAAGVARLLIHPELRPRQASALLSRIMYRRGRSG